MTNEETGPAAAFGRRLRELMRERGLTSRAASGVDVPKLAAAGGITYEMARRYAEGRAVPRPDKLAAIAEWLGVPPSELAFGDSAGQVDAGILEKCVIAVAQAQARTGRNLSFEQSAKLVALLYREATAGRFPTQESVDLLARAA